MFPVPCWIRLSMLAVRFLLDSVNVLSEAINWAITYFLRNIPVSGCPVLKQNIVVLLQHHWYAGNLLLYILNDVLPLTCYTLTRNIFWNWLIHFPCSASHVSLYKHLCRLQKSSRNDRPFVELVLERMVGSPHWNIILRNQWYWRIYWSVVMCPRVHGRLFSSFWCLLPRYVCIVPSDDSLCFTDDPIYTVKTLLRVKMYMLFTS